MSDSFPERLAKAIKISRQHHNHVATRMGMTRGKLSDYLKGLEEPSYDEVERFADLLATSAIWLLTGKHK